MIGQQLRDMVAKGLQGKKNHRESGGSVHDQALNRALNCYCLRKIHLSFLIIKDNVFLLATLSTSVMGRVQEPLPAPHG